MISAFAFGAKRHVVREAYGQLEEFGLLEHIHNRGVFVHEPHPSEVRELFEIRELLEIHASNMTVLPAMSDILDAMRKIEEPHGAAARAAKFRDVLHLNTEFHRVQYSACCNDVLAQVIAGYALRTHLVAANKFGDASTIERVITAMADSSNERLEKANPVAFRSGRISIWTA